MNKYSIMDIGLVVFIIGIISQIVWLYELLENLNILTEFKYISISFIILGIFIIFITGGFKINEGTSFIDAVFFTNHDLCEVCGTKRFMKGTCTKKVTCEDLKLIYNNGNPLCRIYDEGEVKDRKKFKSWIGKLPGKRIIKKETVKKYFS